MQEFAIPKSDMRSVKSDLPCSCAAEHSIRHRPRNFIFEWDGVRWKQDADCASGKVTMHNDFLEARCFVLLIYTRFLLLGIRKSIENEVNVNWSVATLMMVATRLDVFATLTLRDSRASQHLTYLYLDDTRHGRSHTGVQPRDCSGQRSASRTLCTQRTDASHRIAYHITNR